jgi:hypothetical protein
MLRGGREESKEYTQCEFKRVGDALWVFGLALCSLRMLEIAYLTYLNC